MAIIKSVEAIESLIPEPNENKVYMSMITHTSEKAIYSNTVYGVLVDCIGKQIEKIFMLGFSLLSCPNTYFLFVHEVESELTASTPFVKAKTENGEKPKPDDWDFKSDEIGLYANANMFGDKKIYFVTSRLDAKEIKNCLDKEKEKETIVLETVYV